MRTSIVKRLIAARSRFGVASASLFIIVCGMSALTPMAHGAPAVKIEQLVDKPVDWFSGDEGARVVANVVSWQNGNGGWWKGYDASIPRPASLPAASTVGQVPGDDESAWRRTSTIDNGATYTELRLLARAITARDTSEARGAFERGLAFLLTAQYPTGGWPQRYPLEENYGRYVTFNDDAMVNVMRLLDDVARGTGGFAFVDDATRATCRDAFERGIEFILNSQIRTPTGLTVWCQQHDPITYVPTGARSYELPSLSGSESAAILRLLMDVPDPNERVKAAVRAGVGWYKQSAITGKRVERRPDAALPRGVDVVLVDDPNAELLWARFYDLETNRPFYCGRDGVKRWSYMEVEPERRSGYAWIRPWGKKLLEQYPKWAAEHGIDPTQSP